MATITHLPDDVIIIILDRKSISLEDIVNFKSTCKRFQQITLPNKLWERKYYQSCSIAEKKYNREKQKKIFHHNNFQDKIELGLYCIQKLQYYEILMAEYKLCDTDKEQLKRLLHSVAENSMTYYFVWDEINKISAQKSCQLFSNLTREYNFNLIFYCLKQYRFIYKQIKLMNMPKTKLLLEKQLMVMAQYFQPHVSYSAVKTWLDGIAQTVLSCLKNKYPAHSICSTTLEQFSFWRDNNIDDNFWNETESKQIMCILEEYIFSELEIHKLYQLLMISDLEAKCKKYIAVCFRIHLLTVTYHIVARRLGIHSVLITYRTTIEIIWKPKYNTNNWDNAEYFRVNQFSILPYPSNIIRGRYQYNKDLLRDSNYIWLTKEIMINFHYKLKYDENVDNKCNFYVFSNFLSQYYDNVENIDIETEYENIINAIEIRSNGVKKPLKRRTKKVKFAVGMIVTHAWPGFPYNHDGVIVGWHRKCDIMFEDKLKKTFMFPYLRQSYEYNHNCTCPIFKQFLNSAHQMHYIMLSENDTICYVQEDLLSIRPPRKINNIEIGRYFSSFEGTYYVPNENLRKQYPKDTAAIAKILAEQ